MKNPKFIPGTTYIPASGKVYGEEEINNAIEAARDGWWTEGRFTKQFEKDFSKYLGVKYVTLTNSGSSANLLAFASLSSKVFGRNSLKKGDEFITSPVAFPTTVNPGILYGLKPVFVDVKLDTLNINPEKIEKAITKKTKLIILAHTLGKPFDLDKIVKLAKKYHLWLIEDCCDALGSKYDGKLTGTYGDLATFSFYPAHQITMGEGGAVVTNNPLIHRSLRQFRDWGRDCWCNTGRDNTCGKRFGWQLGQLPKGYDHKYTYSQIGFNLKLTDFQAAIGCAQLKKLPGFIRKRKENYRKLEEFFACKSQYFLLMKVTQHEDPCWFGFPLIVQRNAPFTRNQLTEYLEMNKIGTRNVFSGNLLKHPAYLDIKYKKAGKIINADIIMNNAFWIGVYPGIDDEMIKYIKKTFNNFLAQNAKTLLCPSLPGR
ncbi:lipopolysaccharide biosynthesis protein RfbH [Candidatus Microgenomates bacterium]|nr:lipopolysaccharide biosynthesis protein RfbH [Candidatus Microgenomates bacterium]